MICRKCGEDNLDGSSKCKKCGSLLEEKDDTKKAEQIPLTDTSVKLCKCGTLIQDTWDVCPNCGAKLEGKNPMKGEPDYGLDSSGGNILLIIFITLYILPHLLTGFVPNYEYVFIIFRVTCFILIMIAKTKYPENKKVNVLFFLFLIAVAINIIIMCLTHSLEWKF